MNLSKWLALAFVLLLLVELFTVPEVDAWRRRRRRRRRGSRWFRRTVSAVGRGLATAGKTVYKGITSKTGRIVTTVLSTVNSGVGIACCTTILIPTSAFCCGVTRVGAGLFCVTGALQAGDDVQQRKYGGAALGAAGAGSNCVTAITGTGPAGHFYNWYKSGKRKRREAGKSPVPVKAGVKYLAGDIVNLKLQLDALKNACRKLPSWAMTRRARKRTEWLVAYLRRVSKSVNRAMKGVTGHSWKKLPPCTHVLRPHLVHTKTKARPCRAPKHKSPTRTCSLDRIIPLVTRFEAILTLAAGDGLKMQFPMMNERQLEAMEMVGQAVER